MKTFTDNQGQIWTLILTLGKTRKMRESLGLDILNPNHYLQILASLTDRLAFTFLLVEQQANDLRIDADDFEERLYGEGFADKASLAFLGETEVFFQKLGQSAMTRLANRSIETMKSGQTRLNEIIASGQLDSLMEKAEREARENMEKELRASVGSGSLNSQPSPDLVPGD